MKWNENDVDITGLSSQFAIASFPDAHEWAYSSHVHTACPPWAKRPWPMQTGPKWVSDPSCPHIPPAGIWKGKLVFSQVAGSVTKNCGSCQQFYLYATQIEANKRKTTACDTMVKKHFVILPDHVFRNCLLN